MTMWEFEKTNGINIQNKLKVFINQKLTDMFKYFVIACMLVLCQACKPSGDSLVRILENGIEKVEKAKTPEEISKITYDVKDQMMFVGKLPGGDIKMSESNTRKVIDTQNKFYRAIENRLKELGYKQ